MTRTKNLCCHYVAAPDRGKMRRSPPLTRPASRPPNEKFTKPLVISLAAHAPTSQAQFNMRWLLTLPSREGQLDGMSIRQAAREFGLSRKTIRKMLQHSLPPGYARFRQPRLRHRAPRSCAMPVKMERKRGPGCLAT